MYIYNITINVEDSIHDEWLNWMDSHIYDVLNTGKFTSAKFTEVLVGEEFDKTYSVQYTCNYKEDLESYFKEDAEGLREKSFIKYGEKILAFRTELRLIKEYYPTNAKN